MTERNKIEKSEEIKDTTEELGQVQEQDSEKQDLKNQVDELEKELQKRELMINLLCDEIARLEEGD